MTDPISDMLTRIRNAQAVRKTEVILPYSKIKMNIANLFFQQGWTGKIEKIEPIKNSKVKKFKKDINSRFDQIRIEIKYNNKIPHIKSLTRISKPGRRIYVTKDNIYKVLNGYGMAVISTSKGLLTDKEAKKQGIGGEVICEIY